MVKTETAEFSAVSAFTTLKFDSDFSPNSGYFPQHGQVCRTRLASFFSFRALCSRRISSRSFESKYSFIASTNFNFSKFGKFKKPLNTSVIFWFIILFGHRNFHVIFAREVNRFGITGVGVADDAHSGIDG